MYVILLGAPGAGKGTQAVTVSKSLGLAHVSSGDLFREAQAKGTELGLLAKSYMEKGQLVPDEVTVRMVLERLGEPDCAKGAILDGFPRTLDQAKALDTALAGQGRRIDRVAYIKVSTDELLSRLGGRWICRNCQAPYHAKNLPPKIAGKCDVCGGELYQRADDSMETAQKRLGVYFAQTAPLIEYYLEAGNLVEINGEQDVDVVGRILVDALVTGGAK
ncbi:MAG: adenylate kinase [Dehalococcoidia bacterium]|nr:adenylate kinase [Dehalococcoidia bacterium]